MRARRLLPALFLALLTTGATAQQSQPAGNGASGITERDLEEWLTYLSSDELQGRASYTEGLGVAAGYIASHLKQWGVKPAGDGGTYLQAVRVQGIKTNSQASVTVKVNGESRTFKDGEGVTFPRQMGGKQTIGGKDIVFAGYGLQIPAAELDDEAGNAPSEKIVVYLGAEGPSTLPQGSNRLLNARGRMAIEKGAAAVIGPAVAASAGRGRGAQGENPDFTTVQRYDRLVTPQLTAQDEFFEFLFSGSSVKYAELKEKADKREPLPLFALKGVTMTINVDADYQVVRMRLTNNVVGIVEGTDPKLKDTYVAYGAHYDHTGFHESGHAPPATGGGFGCEGQTRPTPERGDYINNGADDDGSGTVALMALARAFQTGERPRRSILFVWHAGEETGLLGSRYFADHPVVPLERIVAQLNIDMIGRNRCDDPAQGNTVFVVGSDRISTELHNLNEEANAALSKPLTLDYEMNDLADPQSIYTRSDHYSYASKGVPIIFYFTGLHRDYHFVTDEVSKIEFPKLTRITRLVYETGRRLANADQAPAKDNLGPRAGKGHKGKLTGK